MAGLATAGVTAASAATTQSASPQAVRACPTSHLSGRILLPGDGGAGSKYYTIRLTNTSGTTCTLYGYPGVAAISSIGKQLGSAAGWDAVHTPRTVTLKPRGEAHSVLRVAQVANFPAASCRPVTATGLRVYPPGQTRSLTLNFKFRACSEKGPKYLGVQAVQAGGGVPMP